MMLKRAYNAGARAALARYKVAIPVSPPGYGADYGVAPSGPELTHGTDRVPHEKNRGTSDVEAALPQDQFNADWLWENQRLDRMAPGYTGEWGQEVIG